MQPMLASEECVREKRGRERAREKITFLFITVSHISIRWHLIALKLCELNSLLQFSDELKANWNEKLFLLAYVTEHAWLLTDRMFSTFFCSH